MAEEVKEVKEENPFDEKSLDKMIEEAKVAAAEVKNAELGAEEEPEEKPTVEIKEDSKEEPKTEKVEEEKPKGETDDTVESQELTDEQFEELSKKYPVLKNYKSVHDDQVNWEKANRQKGQSIGWLAKLSDEEQEKIQNHVLPLVYGKEDMPKAPTDLVDDVMKEIVLDDLTFKDEDDIEVRVKPELYQPIVKREIKKVLERAIPQMAALRETVLKQAGELKEVKANLEASQGRQGEMEFETLVRSHPTLDIRRVSGEESILDAVQRVLSSDKDHPEYHKLVKLQAIGTLAQKNQWTPEKAFEVLYGEEERKITGAERTKKAIEKNQEAVTQEQPSEGKVEKEEPWKSAIGEVGKRENEIEKIFENAEKQNR
jgi:hypothetical protein